MELDLRDLEIILAIKNGIINARKEEMIEDYSNLENYNMLIRGLSILLIKEPTFFLLEDEYIEKTLEIINKKRDKYKTVLNDEINKVILELNSLKNIKKKDKSEMLYNYISEEASKRLYKTLSYDELEKGQAYDIIALTSLLTNNLEMINNNELYLHSLYYLLEEMPPLFIYDDILLTCKNSLKKIKKESGILKIKNRFMATEFDNRLEDIKKIVL